MTRLACRARWPFCGGRIAFVIRACPLRIPPPPPRCRLELAQLGRSHFFPPEVLEAEAAARVQDVDKSLLRLMQAALKAERHTRAYELSLLMDSEQLLEGEWVGGWVGSDEYAHASLSLWLRGPAATACLASLKPGAFVRPGAWAGCMGLEPPIIDATPGVACVLSTAAMSCAWRPH